MKAPFKLAMSALVGTTAALGCLVQGAAGASATNAAGRSLEGASGRIQHLIVIIQSHHSFDNYFAGYPGAAGVPAGVCVPTGSGVGCVKPFTLDSSQSKAGLNDSAASMARAIDGGAMDGFVRAQANAQVGETTMGHYSPSELDYYWSLAKRFTLFDHFFAATPGGSFPNRLFAIAGQDGGFTTAAGAEGADPPTIFAELGAKGISWKYYVQGLTPSAKAAPSSSQRRLVPLLAMPKAMSDPAISSRVTGAGQYFTDLESGNLPAVSYIAGTSSSEQPPQDPRKGEAFVRTIVNALMQSPDWATSAVLLTWDDAGGWYDHVVPPMVGSNPPQQLGLRVPAILISPFSRSGVVVHQQMDTTSILRFIERNWGLAPLTSRDASAASVAAGLDLSRKPIPPQVSLAVAVAPTVTAGSNWRVYAFYLGSVVMAGGILAFAIGWERRKNARGDPVPGPHLVESGR